MFYSVHKKVWFYHNFFAFRRP